jgi:hypothetical protein
MYLKIINFFMLSLVTVLAYGGIDRYIEVGDQLLPNHDFAHGLQGWQASGPATATVLANAGLARLESRDPGSSVQLSHHLAAGGLVGEKVVLRGKLKTVGIAGGSKAWEKGRGCLGSGFQVDKIWGLDYRFCHHEAGDGAKGVV